MVSQASPSLKGHAILVVDDHEPIRNLLVDFLSGLGAEVDGAEGGTTGLAKMAKTRYDLVLVDLRMQDMTGLDVLERARNDDLASNYLMMSAEGTVSSAVRAMNLGASDFLVKPFDLDQLVDGVVRILGTAASATALERDPRLDWRDSTAPYIVGEHPSLLDVFLIIERISHSDCTVLIGGESGTGKELIARAIHDASPRKKHDIVAVNCGAIPESLIESELFGHSKGAFTGATTSREGRFAAAEKGTLFLDEIGEMSLTVQVKFLRVLQECKYTPVGESRPRDSDVRIVAATNKDLFALVESGKFREDLYWRLNVIPIQIPPLRERASDIPALIDYFVGQIRQKSGPQTTIPGFTDSAMQVLQNHSWPGNIRQLEHAIERLVVLNPSDRPLDVEDLGPQFQSSARTTTARLTSLSDPRPPAAARAETPGRSAPPVRDLHACSDPLPKPVDATTMAAAPTPRPDAPPSPTRLQSPETAGVATLELLDQLQLPREGIDLRSALERLEWNLIEQALEISGDKRKHAAELLGLNRTTLVEKLRKRNAKRKSESSESTHQAASEPSPATPEHDRRDREAS